MKRIFLDKASLQLIAVIAMTADHCAFLVPDVWLRGICHFFGRITIIIMSFFIAEGYYKTSNIYKYIIRLGIFALVSQIPFGLLQYGRIPNGATEFYECFLKNGNVIFTLTVALMLLVIIKSDCRKFVKCLALAATLFVTRNSDWNWGCILWVLGFALFYGERKKQMLAASAVIVLKFGVKTAYFIAGAVNGGISYASLYYHLLQLGGFMAIPLLMCYNGEKGKSYGLGFYAFYPLHMMILFIIGIM